jgi:hypothetical protein
MSFEFQSTLVNVTPSYRISGNQIGGVRIENNGGIEVARIIITNDADVKFALSGPYESGNPTTIYNTLAADLYEVATGVLVNEGAIGSVEIEAAKITIDLEGSDRKFTFMPDADVLAATEVADHTWKLTTAGFAALSTAAAAWRSSMDGTLQGLSTAITTEVADRIAADAAEAARVDALIASGMWLYADQAAFPPAADNHGRVVHSHADASMFYAHGGAWHKIENEAEAEAARLVIQNDVDANETASDAAEAALSGRLDTLEADPTTATAVAAGDAATLSSANTYTDTAVSNVIGTAPGVLDTLGEIADAINDDANVYTTLVASIAAVQTDVDGNESDADAADAALSGRLDTLEADPTTATAVAAVQADVDANETASDAADSALSGRLDVLEADPTTATAVAAVQSDVDQNESDADAALAGEATTRANADTALSGRLDVLEADPTTATALAAVQADVDQNEADADAALALKAPLASPDFTGQVDIDTNARVEFADNLTKIHNLLRGTSINIGNNIEVKPAAAGGRVEITGDLIIDASDFVDASTDAAAASAGVVVGQVYRNGSDLRVRIS